MGLEPLAYVTFWWNTQNKEHYGQGQPTTQALAAAWADKAREAENISATVIWIGDKPRKLKPDDVDEYGLRKHV